VPFRDSKLTRLLKVSARAHTSRICHDASHLHTCVYAGLTRRQLCHRYDRQRRADVTAVMRVCALQRDLSFVVCACRFEDTQNTLRYANRAKDIKCQVRCARVCLLPPRCVAQVAPNAVQVEHHVAEYGRLIAALRAEVCVYESGEGAMCARDARCRWLSGKPRRTAAIRAVRMRVCAVSCHACARSELDVDARDDDHVRTPARTTQGCHVRRVVALVHDVLINVTHLMCW
jgi:hypothetical protein